jgi:DNA mismatch endonuclease (patch repair protein)
MMAEGIKPEPQARDLAGRPDFVLREERIAVFIDGSFWHGWRFPYWRHKLSEAWEAKIEANRKRDRRNHAKLRRAGWKVIRIWDFQLERSPEACIRRIVAAINEHHRNAETVYKGANRGDR